MATLGRRLMADFPEHYHYFGVTQARFGGLSIRNHNRMLDSYEGVDGIKTGYIRDSGFNIVNQREPRRPSVSWARCSAAAPGWSATPTWPRCSTRGSPARRRGGAGRARLADAGPPGGSRAPARNARAAQVRQARAEPRVAARAASRTTTSRAVTARPAATTRSGAAAARSPAPAARPAVARGASQSAARQGAKAATSRPAVVAPRAPAPIAPPAGRIRNAELR
jgi:D-alanyl-D-alanine carboxypeptidase